MDAAYLWVSVHSIFEVILLFTLISNWNDRPRRNALLAFTFLYAVVRAWTILYFAPSFLTFQRLSANSQFANPLLEGVVRWKNLNLIRTSLVTGLNVAFLAYVINRLSSRNTRKVLTSKM